MTLHGDMLLKAIGIGRMATLIPQIADPLASPAKGRILAILLPSLQLLALVGVLDDALEEYVNSTKLPWPAKRKRDLYNRIAVVAAHVPSVDEAALQELRKLRNAIAHTTDLGSELPISWQQVELAAAAIAAAFVGMGFLGEPPDVEAHYSRDVKTYLAELGPSGERLDYTHRLWAQVDGQVLVEYTDSDLRGPPTRHSPGEST